MNYNDRVRLYSVARINKYKNACGGKAKTIQLY